MRALVHILTGNAKARRADPNAYTASFVGIANDFDKELGRRMQAICDAQKNLDDYLLARTENK